MNEWKRMFKSYILERGWDYYQSDRVRDINPTAHGYSAMVDGTDAYTVDIIIQDGYVIDMLCDCPYADDGNYCKHMAAVLYNITEEYFEKYKQIYEENQKNEKQELTEIISKIPEKELRELILQLALKEQYIGYLDRYEKVLKKRFPIQVRDRYIAYVKQEADRASYRKAYKDLITYLNKIKKYPDGMELIKEIASEWRIEYRRRTAMMDELKRAGF